MMDIRKTAEYHRVAYLVQAASPHAGLNDLDALVAKIREVETCCQCGKPLEVIHRLAYVNFPEGKKCSACWGSE